MTRHVLTSVSLATAAAFAAPAMAQEACSSAPVGDAPYQCLCAGNDLYGTVWGSNPYTADSDVCTAAVHAGALGLDGGIVRVVPTAGLDSYEGSTANGVETRAWGSYGQSITFEVKGGGSGGGAMTTAGEMCGAYPVGQAEYLCTCPPYDGTGAVWGSGPYTADSDICLAAIHAGLIGADGGDVWLRETEGQDSYEGSNANGVETRSWGSYATSFTFEPESPFILQTENAASGDCAGFPTGAESFSCTCAPGPYSGSVWGNGPYTADSDLCTAARHTGVIGDGGGPITALGLGGLEVYTGTTFNGITTRDWGAYSESFVFNWN